jgi:outer membrane protein, heavy metal efflux system
MNMFTRSMRWKKLALITSGCLFLPLALASESMEENELTVEAAVEIAVRDNPNLAQLQERYKALTEIPSQVGALPDPVINFNTLNFPVPDFNRRQEAMTQVQLGFVQAFPFPGKLGIKEETAEFEALAASHSVDELRLQLISSVRNKWWQVYFFDHALETVYNNQALFREFIKVAKTKYETGDGLQQDVLLAQLELSGLFDHEIQIKAMRRTQAIQLNVLMDLPTRVSVNLPKIVPTELPPLLAKEVFFKKAEEFRPLLKQRETEIDVANSRLKFAKKDTLPDFSVGVNYGDRRGDNPLPRSGSRDNFFTFMLGVKVPIYSKRKQYKAIDQRATELQRSYYSSQDEKARVLGSISIALTDYDRAREEFSLFETGIIPQASQTVQSMLAGYQVNEVDFLNLVRAQVTLLDYELEYWKALTEAKQSLARLEAAVGEETIYE